MDIPRNLAGLLVGRLGIIVNFFCFEGVIIWVLSQKATGALFVKRTLWVFPPFAA